jgi:hypothetical protein
VHHTRDAFSCNQNLPKQIDVASQYPIPLVETGPDNRQSELNSKSYIPVQIWKCASSGKEADVFQESFTKRLESNEYRETTTDTGQAMAIRIYATA